jgi:alpha-L-fucosidase 2
MLLRFASLRRPFLAWLALGLIAVVSARTTTRDVEFGSAGGERLLLDVSVPDGDGPFPVVVLVHGGGWSGGDKSGGDIAPWFDLFNHAGVVWFSVNYRLAPAHRWPAQIEDVRTALRWIKANAARHRGDVTRIALVGHSAGGHLAFLAAVEDDPTTAVHAVVGYAPVTDFEQELPVRGGLSKSLRDLHDRPHELTPDSLALLRDTAPLNRLAPGAPPFLIVHGDRDRTVPLQQSLNFQARARATGNTCDLHVIPGGGHRLANWNDLDPAYYRRILQWLNARFIERGATATSAPRPVPPDSARPPPGRKAFPSVERVFAP